MPSEVIEQLFESEIPGQVSWLYDDWFHVKIGNPILAEETVRSFGEANRWLDRMARELFPESRYATGSWTAPPETAR